MSRVAGIRCPVCNCLKMPPLPGRIKHAGSVTIRVRQCKDCATRIETREMMVKTVSR